MLLKKTFSLKGAITVESAIFLPCFIILIITFVYIIKVYYTYDVVQNAISGAANQMSVYSLLYYETNAEEIVGCVERFTSSEEVTEKLGENWLTDGIQKLGKDATDYARAQIVLVPAAKVLVRSNLEAGVNSANDKLKALNLNRGFESLDFSESRLLADGKSVDITVCYQMCFPFLSDFLPSIKVRQTASSCIWAGENGVSAIIDEDEETQEKGAGIWNLSNIARGKEIRKLQGANLPFNFPTIAKFQDGKATGIKSLNIDEAYYKNTGNLEKKVMSYVNKLEEFQGGSAGGVTIDKSDISSKELILVIPETDVSPAQQAVIDKCISKARSKGITLKIVKAYGKQGEAGHEDNSANKTKDKDGGT